MMKISVVICTYNRAESLKRTLKSMLAMPVPESLPWEVIVVDNNSQDSTRAVVEEFKAEARADVVYVFEGKSGLSHARNRGIQEAKGDVIAFTDDDVLLERDWLSNIYRIFQDESAACIGGRILPFWEKEPPLWLKSELYSYLALQDHGDEPLRMKEPHLWGANFAVRSPMFRKYGCFNTELGRTPKKLFGKEEVDFIRKLIAGEEGVFYYPSMVVHHCIPESRMKKSYFRKWKYDSGELYGMQLGQLKSVKDLRLTLYLVKEIGANFMRFLWTGALKPQDAFVEQLRFVFYVGFLVGRLKYQTNSGRLQ